MIFKIFFFYFIISKTKKKVLSYPLEKKSKYSFLNQSSYPGTLDSEEEQSIVVIEFVVFKIGTINWVFLLKNENYF